MIGTILLFLVLLALSGFFSGSEIALFSISQARARALADEGRAGAASLVAMKSTPDRLLVTILVGNNVVNIAAASLATWLTTRAMGSAGVGVATGIVTVLVLFFGEITPKSYAAANPARLSLIAAPILQFLSRVLFFLVGPLASLTRKMVPRKGRRGGHGVTEAEIRRMTQMGHVAGVIEEHEREIIERTFLLDTTRAWEVMVPRVDVFAWEAERSLLQIMDELGRVPFSRIPVYRESLDDIVGVLYLRDAYQALIAGRDDLTLGELAREPFFVPETLTLVELLGEFQARRIHLGIVVDEYGGTDGLITLEDILEELVGDIVDEVDVPEQSMVRVDRNQVLVDGSTDLREINQYFHTTLPAVEHRSLNGYLLEELGEVPQAGETLRREDLLIEVLGATETQVTRARVTARGRPGHAEAVREAERLAREQRTEGTEGGALP